MIAGQKHAHAPQKFAARYSYRDHVLPILQAKCQPCHFEGGKVYGKLPFTDSTVVAKLGKKLNTRLKDSADQATVLAWTSQTATR